MKTWINKHAVPLCMLLCVLMLMGAWAGIRVSANAGTFRISNIEGNAKFIEGVTADMVIEDGTHIQHLTMDSGALSHEYQYKMPITNTYDTRYDTLQQFVEHEDADVQVTIDTELDYSDETKDEYTKIMRRTADKARVSVLLEHYETQPSHNLDVEWVQVITDVTVQDDRHPFVFMMDSHYEDYKNQTTPDGVPLQTEPIVTPFNDIGTEVSSELYVHDAPLYAEDANGTFYLTPALHPYHCGQSAIYRIDEWGGSDYMEEPLERDGYEYFPMRAAMAQGKATTVAAFPIDGHELRTVKLDVVDNHLCLLLVVDGTLTLHVYNMDGTLEHELTLFEYNPDQPVHSTLYTNQSEGATMLCYRLATVNPKPDELLFCVALGETAEFRSVITGHPLLMHSAYIDGHWVLLERDSLDTYDQQHPAYTPPRYTISALDDNGDTLYAGELVTNTPEDFIQYYFAMEDEWVRSMSTVTRWLQCNTITEDN